MSSRPLIRAKTSSFDICPCYDGQPVSVYARLTPEVKIGQSIYMLTMAS